MESRSIEIGSLRELRSCPQTAERAILQHSTHRSTAVSLSSSLPPLFFFTSPRTHCASWSWSRSRGLGTTYLFSTSLSSTYSYSSSSSSPPSAHLSLADSGPIPPLLLLSVLCFCSTLSYVLSVERVPTLGGPITLPVFPSFSLLPVRQLFQRGFYYALRVPLNNPASFFAFSLCGTGLH